MPKRAATPKKPKDSTANLGFETKLWLAADKLRNNMDAAEYKHVVLGLIFLKYISDAFEEMRSKLVEGRGHYAGSDPEQKDEYLAENVFWVPKEARWSFLQAKAKQSDIGKLLDDAMVTIERDNPRLKGVLPKDYARPALDKQRLGELIDLIGTIGMGDKENRAKDVLGRVYEYFLTQFAGAEGKNGGQFYTPSCIVRLIVEMLVPLKGRVYDPCGGSGGMFVQSEKFVEAHGGKLGDIAVYGQESNAKVTAVDTRAILSKLSQLPVTEWEYKHKPDRRYIGPMAQDFHAVFGLGEDDKGIGTLDSDGVMYAAIQGLVEELKDRDKAIEELKSELQAIREQLSNLPPAP